MESTIITEAELIKIWLVITTAHVESSHADMVRTIDTITAPKPTPTPTPTPGPTLTPIPMPANVISESTFSYVLNTNTKKFHYPDCRSVGQMKEKNKYYFDGTRSEVIAMGYSPCGNCHP